MSHWYVNEFAKLAGVTVQTLHYYDRSNVLKSSARHTNGYRVYTQTDLVKLQQVIALRFFGFGLKEIKNLLAGEVDVQQQLAGQIMFLEQRGNSLLQAAASLKDVMLHNNNDAETTSVSVVSMIEVYHMMEQFEKTWLGTVFTKEQLKRLVTKDDSVSMVQQQAYSKAWDELVALVAKHVHDDPYSPEAQQLAKQWMDLVNKYSSDRDLGEALWGAYKKGDVPTNEVDRAGYPYIPQDVVQWIDKAVYFMYSGKKR